MVSGQSRRRACPCCQCQWQGCDRRRRGPRQFVVRDENHPDAMSEPHVARRFRPNNSLVRRPKAPSRAAERRPGVARRRKGNHGLRHGREGYTCGNQRVVSYEGEVITLPAEEFAGCESAAFGRPQRRAGRTVPRPEYRHEQRHGCEGSCSRRRWRSHDVGAFIGAAMHASAV